MFYFRYHQWNSKPEFVVATHRVSKLVFFVTDATENKLVRLLLARPFKAQSLAIEMGSGANVIKPFRIQIYKCS